MGIWLTTSPDEIWPSLAEGEIASAERLIEKAERLIQARFRTIDDRILRGQISPETIADIVEAMVDRALQSERRGGMSEVSYPEFSMKWDEGGAGTGSKLYLTMDELLILNPVRTTGAFSVRRKATPRLPR